MLHIYNAQSAKKAARSLEKFATSLGFELKHGQALDALATMTGFQNWAALNDSVSQEAIDAKLMPVELDHIEDNQDVTYGPEYAVMAHNGFELRYAQGDEPLDYVRICDPLGREIAYWVSDEWQQDPQAVMGAILGALVQGGPLEVGAAKKPAKASGPAREATRPPTIMDLYPFDAVAHVVVDGRSFPVRYLDGDVAQLLEEPAADFDEEDDASHVVLDLHFEEDGRDVDHPLTVAELRELRWSAKEGGFVNKKGTLYEFYIEQKFGASASVAPKAAEVARSEDGPIELFEVFCRAPDGVQATSGVARVAAKSAQGP
ncbi:MULTISPECIES: hypothetical protein [unclassified Variovorax]|uniref:hypothetical protein n=1 Tax=unclassified Variovorax TaxID=663243 RepID=UPI0013167336|nr:MULTISPECIES: hypothetical protein [unclassified Variovorax]VTU42260.1 hypothetical protein H6P1_00141 [Variovorax sp. PBL-H6]VTU44122.1 hypothetical protein SRS16P1_00761 [Variovorax sp. SRS16]VTU44204.1 hypothetical protein E5P1_00754 [Variovorax sp. PBL-E5]